MAQFNLKRFANTGVLRAIQRNNLIQLLAPYADYFALRGIAIPRQMRLRAVSDDFGADDHSTLDYDTLAKALLDPDENTPAQLVDALFIIDETASAELMPELLRIAEAVGLGVSPHDAPADVATKLYLKAPRFLERIHAERFVTARKSFRYFMTEDLPQGAFDEPTASSMQDLEKALGQWFESRKKGDLVRALVAPKAGETWFLIRHGEGFRREPAQKDGRSTSVFYRPERYDLAVYTHAIGELRINACNDAERERYRQLIGRHLFGSDDHFPSKQPKYTLDPLRVQGEQSLVCSDIAGIEWVRLTEIMYLWGGSQNEVEVRRATDLFEALRESGRRIEGARIIGAKFEVKFTDSKTARMVSLRPPTIASFTRDSDGALISKWLARRGFDFTKRRHD